MEEETESTLVYECWVADDRESFVKFDHCGKVEAWVHGRLNALGVGAHLHIGVHAASEYEQSPLGGQTKNFS